MQIGDTYEYKNVVTKEITAGALGSGGLDIFKVEAYDNKGLIGEGTHERAIIDCERFMKKCLAKLED